MSTLRDLKPGERGVVVGWAGASPPTRLLEMGVLQGTEIEVVKLAPLGDPIEVKLRGYHLSLRKQEAEQIEIARAGESS
ncbi:MAG: ferrous iron transport protein A [Deltaproteobacteria bacterium]|nr:ferrous iron transport protein A [Deltaproteobacteria bacterium]MBW2362841.1 ferrous iron transport protein A [Deltaproteobacteria bacterium]